MKHVLTSIRILLFLTLITGVVYPAFVTSVSQILFFHKAKGSLISKNGFVIGSELIAQKFESAKYFWPRPSAIDYNPQPSGGSNLGQASQGLKEAVESRKAKLSNAPQDLLFASGSGLDPHISGEAAIYQVSRVAQARGLDKSAVADLVQKMTKRPSLGIFGESTVNVLELNLALDELK